MLMLMGMVLLLCVISSTREGRAAARQRLKRYDLPIGIAAALLWGIIILGFT